MNGKIHQINLETRDIPTYPIERAFVSLEQVISDNGVHDKLHLHRKPGNHEGSQQALCLYSLECLKRLQNEGFPVSPGTLGENVTTEGLDYHAVRIGDIYQLGPKVRVRINKIRTPCQRIADAYGEEIITAMFDGRVKRCDYTSPKWGMTGFYAEVFRQGMLQRGDDIERLSEGDPDIPFGKWRHFKGGEYDVLEVALDSEKNPPEQIVVYRARGNSHYGPHRVWTRSKQNFLEMMQTPQGKVPRFTFEG
ncbi:DUF1653 domain-containing protein [Candidatus Woesearchaeota archaeon]|nr:DUF1653 domain-containing protein [Candidatus Woesearchaeota archaeon]